MEYLTNSKRRIKKRVNVKRGKMYIPHYEEKFFDEIPVTLVDWHDEIPDNVIIESEEEKEIFLPIDACVKMQDDFDSVIVTE